MVAEKAVLLSGIFFSALTASPPPAFLLLLPAFILTAVSQISQMQIYRIL